MPLAVLVSKIFLLVIGVAECYNFSLLRHGAASIGERNERRGLQGKTAVIDGKVITTSTSYSGYTDSEVPAGNRSPQADAADFLRNGDQCLKDGTISRSNCGSVPNCSFTGQFGPAKLCINRLPTTAGGWYVAAMKCVPQWENCDKCMCGLISSDEGADATCKFDGQKPDDDSTTVDCSKLSSATINGITINVGSAEDNNKSNATTSVSGKSFDKAAESMGPYQTSPLEPAQLDTVKQESQTSKKPILLAALGLVSAASLLACTIVVVLKRRAPISESKDAHDDKQQQNDNTLTSDQKCDVEHFEFTEEGRNKI